MTPQGCGGRRRNRKKGKNRATAGGELNQHVTAAGPSTSASVQVSNPIPNWRNPDAAHSFPGRDALLVSTLEARVRSFLSSLYLDSPCAYSRIFTKYLQPSLEAHLRNHFIFLESDDLWEQLLGWRPLHTPESARAMGSSLPPRFKLPNASLFGPSRTDYSRSSGPRGWASPWWQDHSGVASTWAAIGVEIGGDGAPVHLDYAQDPAETSGNTPAGRLPTFSTPVTHGGQIQHQFVPYVQARPGVFMSSAPRSPGIFGSSANLGTSGPVPGGNSPVFSPINSDAAAPAAGGRRSPSIFTPSFSRLSPGGNRPVFTPINSDAAAPAAGGRRSPSIFTPPFSRLAPGRRDQFPSSPMSTAQARSPTPPHRYMPPVTNDDFLTAGHDGWAVAETISALQAPAQARVSSHQAPAPRIPTPPMPRLRSSSAGPPPSPYALAEEASVLLEVFCQSLNEDAASVDLTQNRDLIKGARDNVNKIWDTLCVREGKGLAPPSHDDQDPTLMVYSGCVICYSSVAETVLLPCNHLVLCLVRLHYRAEWICLLFIVVVGS